MSTAAARAPEIDLDAANDRLARGDAAEVVQWAVRALGDGLIATTSFGAQAAVMLHLVTGIAPDLPVVFIDTGFHFPETYRFADEMTRRLKLNLKVYAAPLSPGWMVARHGRLWENPTRESLDLYDQMRKVQPMRRAIEELKATGWLTGLRRDQTDHRATLRHVELQDGLYKIHPILTWSSRDVYEYLKRHDLPTHPLYEKGYRSIGDWHSTLRIGETEHERAGRFAGLKQECGLHLPETAAENASRESSGL